jgi:hypothetical protein
MGTYVLHEHTFSCQAGVLEAEEKAEMPLKIGTGERTRSEWFWRTLVCWLAVAAIFAAIRFL